MFEHELLIFYNHSPDCLRDLCLYHISNNLDIITEFITPRTYRRLKDGISLPKEICERFIVIYQKNRRINDEFASIFCDCDRTKLQYICLKKAQISDVGLHCFMRHKPRILELIQCEFSSHEFLDIINAHSENLVYINYQSGDAKMVHKQTKNLIAPQLKGLTLFCQEVMFNPVPTLKSLENLTHLDLSELNLNISGKIFDKMKNLRSLILYNVHWINDIIEHLPKLKALKRLDLSQSNEDIRRFENPNEVLSFIVNALPDLESLDISGTNLAGSGSVVTGSTLNSSQGKNAVHVRCDIPGLISRVNRPLQYLGLFGTEHGACRRHDIPAHQIAGDADEDQMVTAAAAYMTRPEMLSKVLDEIRYLFPYNNTLGSGKCFTRLIYVVLDAMSEHPNHKYIHMCGSYILFGAMLHIREFQHELKCRILNVVLDSMVAHFDYKPVVWNGSLTLSRFGIPVDLLCVFERLIRFLLTVITDGNQERFVHRIAVYMLNAMSYNVDTKRKIIFGETGTIKIMLHLILKRVAMLLCDDVLELVWSFMEKITDDTPTNSLYFVKNKGIKVFQHCFEKLPMNEGLLCNMMGPLRNVAEVPEARPALMNTAFLNIIYNLLNSTSNGIGVSYNAAGILAYIASDGVEAWTVKDPDRNDVLNRIEMAIGRWNNEAERNVHCFSFEPIVALLGVYHTPQCQLWAVWALANLTTVYPEKYCQLLRNLGGEQILQQLRSRTSLSHIIELVDLIFLNFFLEELPRKRIKTMHFDSQE